MPKARTDKRMSFQDGQGAAIASGPYGLRSWRCQPTVMPLPHRHSDVELNLLLDGAVTYVHRDRFVRT